MPATRDSYHDQYGKFRRTPALSLITSHANSSHFFSPKKKNSSRGAVACSQADLCTASAPPLAQSAIARSAPAICAVESHPSLKRLDLQGILAPRPPLNRVTPLRWHLNKQSKIKSAERLFLASPCSSSTQRPPSPRFRNATLPCRTHWACPHAASTARCNSTSLIITWISHLASRMRALPEAPCRGSQKCALPSPAQPAY